MYAAEPTLAYLELNINHEYDAAEFVASVRVY